MVKFWFVSLVHTYIHTYISREPKSHIFFLNWPLIPGKCGESPLTSVKGPVYYYVLDEVHESKSVKLTLSPVK